MSKYTCYICRKEYDLDGDMLTEITEDEVLLCPACADVVKRLTGQDGREVEVSE